MFDIGFTELLVCLVVALVVIGPEQLPGTVRTVGLWIGRLKRSLRDTRNEIERQIGADEIRRQLHNEEVMQNLEEARLRIEQTMREAEAAASITNSEQPKAADYGPPDELPDHAHGSDSIAQPEPSRDPKVDSKPAPASQPVAAHAGDKPPVAATAAQPAASAPTSNTQVQSGTGH